MCNDPIVEEVRQARDKYAKQFNYDVYAIVADLRKREELHPERLASPARDPLVPQTNE